MATLTSKERMLAAIEYKETEAAVINALELFGREGGFILSPVDNLRDDTDNAWKNTHVFVDTCKTLRADY